MGIEIEMYETRRGDNPVVNYLKGLISASKEKAAIKIIKNIERLKREGFSLLRTPDIFSNVPGYKDLYELRTKYGGEHRVMFGKVGPKIWALDAFLKKSQKLKENDIQRSFNRLKKLKKQKEI